MPSFRKIYCAFHDKQLITNFCMQSNCLMPLCPSCIGSHNEFHKNNRSKATYNSMDNVLQHTYNGILQLIQSFQDQQKRIESISSPITQIPPFMYQQIMKAKTLIINEINKSFELLQKEIVFKMCRKQQVKIPQIIKFVQFQLKTIDNSLIQLQKMAQSLHGQRCLSTVIKFHESEFQKFSTLKAQLGTTLNEFQRSQHCLQINNQIFQQIGPFLKSFVNVDDFEPSLVYNSSSYGDTFEIGNDGNSIYSSSNFFRQIGLNGNNQLEDCTRKALDNQKLCQTLKYDNQIQNLSRKLAEMRKSNGLMNATLKARC